MKFVTKGNATVVYKVDDNPFAPQSIEDVIKILKTKLADVSSVEPDEFDDAVQVGILAVYDYWLPKYGTRPMESSRRVNLAANFAFHRAREILEQTADRHKNEVPFTFDAWFAPEDEQTPVLPLYYESAEDTVMKKEDKKAVHDTWTSLTNGQKERCSQALFCRHHLLNPAERKSLQRERTWATGFLRMRASRYGV